MSNGCAPAKDSALVVLALEHRVLEKVALDFLLHLDGRQLQQLDRLLQLRRQRQMLGRV